MYLFKLRVFNGIIESTCNYVNSKLINKLCTNFLIIISKYSVVVIDINLFKVLEKCTKNLIGHSRLAFNNHESNIDC